MTHRFFKLLYVFALVAIGLSLPIYLLTEMQFDAITRTTYKAKCLSNNQYVVLQGSQAGEAYEFDEFVLNSTFDPTGTERNLNFYCRYYDAVQPHITAYNETRTSDERWQANIAFDTFKNNTISSVSAYPPLYELEVVSEEFQPYELYGPIVAWLVGALMAFVLLQIARMSYLYVAFGQVVWHPFRGKK